MPTLLREGSYRFYFYLGDRPEPPTCMCSVTITSPSSGWTR